MKYYFCLLFLLSFSLAFSVPKLDIARYGSSAKSISIGRVEGFTNKSVNVFENAASLANISKINISEFLSSSIGNDVKFSSFSLAIPLTEGTLSIGHMSAQVKDLIHTKIDTESNFIVANSLFDYHDYIIKIAYGISLNSFINVGTSLNYYSFKMGNFSTGNGYNLDFSILYMPNNVYSLSLILNNTIPSLDMNYDNNTKQHLPFRAHLGHRLSFRDINLYFKMQYRDSTPKIEPGLGMDFPLPYLSFIIINLGISQTYPLSSYVTHINTGLDIALSPINISFGYEKSSYYLSPNQYYLTFNLDL